MVTVIATGFKGANESDFRAEAEEVKRVVDLESNRRITSDRTERPANPNPHRSTPPPEPPAYRPPSYDERSYPRENQPDEDAPAPRREEPRPYERRTDVPRHDHPWNENESSEQSRFDEPDTPSDLPASHSWDIGPSSDANPSASDDRDVWNGGASEDPPADETPPSPSYYSRDRFDEPPSRSEDEEEQQLFQRELSHKKRALMEEAYERKLKMRGRKSISSPDSTQEQFFQKENFNEPAYMRKNVHLYSTPPSNDKNVSRYSLDDENNIVGNNRFLHDNVD